MRLIDRVLANQALLTKLPHSSWGDVRRLLLQAAMGSAGHEAWERIAARQSGKGGCLRQC